MAVAIDASGPAGVTTTAATALATASFTPPVGSKMIAMASTGGTLVPSGTMTDSLGGTWTLIDSETETGQGGVFAYYQDVSAATARTVTWTSATGTHKGNQLKVWVITGAGSGSGGIIGTAKANNASTAQQAITPVNTGSVVLFGATYTDSNKTLVVNGSTTNDLATSDSSNGETYAEAYLTALTTAGTPVTVGYTTALTGADTQTLAVEVGSSGPPPAVVNPDAAAVAAATATVSIYSPPAAWLSASSSSVSLSTAASTATSTMTPTASSVTAATSSTTAAARLMDTAYLTGTSLHLPGISYNYASTPNAAILDVLGDIDLRVNVKMPAWEIAPSQQILISKYTGAAGKNQYMMFINTISYLYLSWSADGVNQTSQNSSVLISANVAAGTQTWLRATMQVNDGAGHRVIKFYTSPDGVTWNQLGVTQTVTGTTSIATGTGPLEIGTYQSGSGFPSTGEFYRAQVYNGIAGTLVFDADFTAPPARALSFVENANGALVSINGSPSGARSASQATAPVNATASTGNATSAATTSSTSGTSAPTQLTSSSSAVSQSATAACAVSQLSGSSSATSQSAASTTATTQLATVSSVTTQATELINASNVPYFISNAYATSQSLAQSTAASTVTGSSQAVSAATGVSLAAGQLAPASRVVSQSTSSATSMTMLTPSSVSVTQASELITAPSVQMMVVSSSSVSQAQSLTAAPYGLTAGSSVTSSSTGSTTATGALSSSVISVTQALATDTAPSNIASTALAATSSTSGITAQQRLSALSAAISQAGSLTTVSGNVIPISGAVSLASGATGAQAVLVELAQVVTRSGDSVSVFARLNPASTSSTRADAYAAIYTVSPILWIDGCEIVILYAYETDPVQAVEDDENPSAADLSAISINWN